MEGGTIFLEGIHNFPPGNNLIGASVTLVTPLLEPPLVQ
jgi:hypothetical protein